MKLATRTKTPPPPIKTVLQQADVSPIVTVMQYAYRVDWGEGVRPRLHTVNKRKQCQCALGKDCPSVNAVAEYLASGGQRAPDYPEDFWPAVPAHCPICHQPCAAYSSLNFKRHGVGWACSVGGVTHYWEARALPIKKALTARKGQPRWVLPPAYNASGEVLYPGVTLEDVILTQRRAHSQRMIPTPGRFSISE